MDLRQAERDELYNVAVFLDDCWRQVYRHILSDEFLDSMSSDERHNRLIKRYDEGVSDFLIMFENESLVGAAVFGKSFTEGYETDGEISAIYLSKDYIGKGYGHDLFVKIEQMLRDKGYKHFVLDVLSANTRALDFYFKHGYEKVADRTISISENEYPLTVLRKLNAKLAEPMDVDEYIDAQPLMYKDKLRTVRQMIRMALPDAMEKISWQMPTYWHGKNLIHFAAQKNHIGIYPGAEAMEHFKPRLEKYKTSKGAIRFPYNSFDLEQLNLITEIAAWCGKDRK